MDSTEKNKLVGSTLDIALDCEHKLKDYDINLNVPTINLAEIDFNSLGSNSQSSTSGLYTYTTNTGTNPGGFLGAGQVTWPQINPTISAGLQPNSGKLEIHGQDADIVIKGKSLMKCLEQIEQRLNILEPNVELEAEWDELRELGQRYRELEQKCKEKTKVWNQLKSMPPPPTL